MSCDLTDRAMLEAYEEIVSGQSTNWLILGYHDTRDKISLYSKGSEGLDELRNNLKEEVLYGFLRIENRFVLLIYVSEAVSGVRRARALVHGRAVGALFKAHQIQINASTPNDLTEANVRNRLKLGEPSDKPSSPPRRQQTLPGTSTGSPILTQDPSSPISPQTDGETNDTESENRAAENAERQAREEQRRATEQAAKEAVSAQRRATEEAEKRKLEAADQERKEREAKAKAELDRKAREEAEKKHNEDLRNKFAELEKSGKVLLNGYITVQGGGVYFWKRRFFELRGKTLYLYCDKTDKLPISKLELDGQVTGVTDAQSEVLILNSFKVNFQTSEPYYFFSDDKKNKESIVAAIGRYAK